MYYRLVSAMKRRLVLELQDAFSRHPVYKKIAPFIQSKYVFEERPQYGIVVTGSSSTKVQLAGDNFIGYVHSHVMLNYLEKVSYMLEWVREDTSVVKQLGKMPTAPGVYYFECLSAPTNATDEGSFAIDPLLSVIDEEVLFFQSGLEDVGQLQRIPATGTVRLWENRNYPLKEGKDYTIDHKTGAIRFLVQFHPNSLVTADYLYAAPSLGPFPFKWNSADTRSLPGIILAFGKRAEKGDTLAVRVYPEREDVAKAFGGKFEVNFELTVIARDPTQMEEIADFAVMSLWGEKKNVLELDGIEILDVSMGGEAEEAADETGDLFFYNASLSVQARADWEVHVPMPLAIYKATAVSKEAEDSVTADRRTTAKNNLVVMSKGGLFVATSPILVGLNDDYERIS